MNKETIARQQITITDVHDGEKGLKGDTGTAAEFYRLQSMEETALVGVDNVLRVKLAYAIEHVKGEQVTKEKSSSQGYHVVVETSTGKSVPMTEGEVSSCTYQLEGFSKAKDCPDFINVELRDKANKTLDRRTVQITMEAASFVNVIGDVRETVSQNGKDITTIQQDARGIRLQVESLKSGTRNLLKGGQLKVSYSTYGLPSAFRLKLKPDTDYTLTVCGRISEDALKKGQTLRTYVFDKDFNWASSCGIQSTSDTAASVTFRIPADRHSPEDYIISCFPYPNQEPKGRNGEVTVNWITLTEGTQPEKAWIPAEGEDVYTQMSKAGMEIKDGEIIFTANKTKLRNNKDEDVTIFNADGTIDARRIIAEGTDDRIEYGIIDGRANLIIKDKQGNTMLLLNRNGIVLPTDITAYARRITAIMSVKDASDGVYLSVSFGFPLYVRNTGFQRSTFGNNIRIEVDAPSLGIKNMVVPVGSGQSKTLNVDDSAEIIYNTTYEHQYKAGIALPLTPDFEYRVIWRGKIINSGNGQVVKMA